MLDFTNQDLFGSCFRDMDLTGADFTNSRLDYCDFTGACLFNAKLDGVLTLSNTIGNNLQIKNIHICEYPVAYTSTHITADCAHFPIEWWQKSTVSDIQALHGVLERDLERAKWIHSLMHNVVLESVRLAPAK